MKYICLGSFSTWKERHLDSSTNVHIVHARIYTNNEITHLLENVIWTPVHIYTFTPGDPANKFRQLLAIIEFKFECSHV
jgi:hypothetical protein